MSGLWLAIKWLIVGLAALYFIFQSIAIWRLQGELRDKCIVVLRMMVVVLCVAPLITVVFGSIEAKSAALVIVGTFCAGATVALVRLLGFEKTRAVAGTRE